MTNYLSQKILQNQNMPITHLVTEPNELYATMLGCYFLGDMYNLLRIILLGFVLEMLEPKYSSVIQ